MGGDAGIDAGIAVAEIADDVGQQRALRHRLGRRDEDTLGAQPLGLGPQRRARRLAVDHPLDVLVAVNAVQHGRKSPAADIDAAIKRQHAFVVLFAGGLVEIAAVGEGVAVMRARLGLDARRERRRGQQLLELGDVGQRHVGVVLGERVVALGGDVAQHQVRRVRLSVSSRVP